MKTTTTTTAKGLAVIATGFALALGAPVAAQAEGASPSCTNATGDYTGGTLSWSVGASCTDPEGDTLTVVSVSAVTGAGTASTDGSTVFYNGSEGNGVETATFTAVVSDGTGSADWAFTVTYDLPAPTVDARDDAYNGTSGTPVTGDLTANDSPADGGSAVVTSDPAHGSVTVNEDGTFTYTSDADYTGTDTFSYSLTVDGVSDVADVTIAIAPSGNGGGDGGDEGDNGNGNGNGGDENNGGNGDAAENDQDALPNTGSSLTSVIAIGAGALLAGAAAVVIARRRRGAAADAEA